MQWADEEERKVNAGRNIVTSEIAAIAGAFADHLGRELYLLLYLFD